MSSPNNERWQTLEEYIDGCEDINMSFSNVNLQSLEEDPDDFEGIDVSFSDEQWQTLGEDDSNDLYIQNNVINDDPLTIVVDQGVVEDMREKVIIRDYSNETIEAQLKWIRDANAKAYTNEERAVSKVATIGEQAGPSTSSSAGASTSAATGFDKQVGKGKKIAGKSNEKDAKGPKMKKRGGKKKHYK